MPVGVSGVVKIECGSSNYSEKKHATRLKAVYVEGPLESKDEGEKSPLEFAFALLKSVVAASAVEDVGNYWCLDTSDVEDGSNGKKTGAEPVRPLSTGAAIWGALCERGMISTLASFLALTGLCSPYFTPLARVITQCMRFACLSDASTFSVQQLAELRRVAKRIRVFALPLCFELEERNKRLLTSYGFYGTQLQAVYELASAAEQVVGGGGDERGDGNGSDVDLLVATQTVQGWPVPGTGEAMQTICAILLQHTRGEFVLFSRRRAFRILSVSCFTWTCMSYDVLFAHSRFS